MAVLFMWGSENISESLVSVTTVVALVGLEATQENLKLEESVSIMLQKSYNFYNKISQRPIQSGVVPIQAAGDATCDGQNNWIYMSEQKRCFHTMCFPFLLSVTVLFIQFWEVRKLGRDTSLKLEKKKKEIYIYQFTVKG